MVHRNPLEATQASGEGKMNPVKSEREWGPKGPQEVKGSLLLQISREQAQER